MGGSTLEEALGVPSSAIREGRGSPVSRALSMNPIYRRPRPAGIGLAFQHVLETGLNRSSRTRDYPWLSYRA
jgi:hypothetical protein